MPQSGQPLLADDEPRLDRSPSAPGAVDYDGLEELNEEIGNLSVIGQPRSRARRSSWRSLLLSYALTVFVLISLNFFLPRAMPGDPISALIEPGSPTSVPSESLRAELEEYYGLDQPVWAQYVDYLSDLARGDLGVSIRFNVPVSELVQERLPWTVLLVGTSLALATALGWVLGAHSGWRQGRAADQGLLGVFLAMRGFPSFFLASIALFVFAVHLEWVPLAGATTPFATSLTALEQVADVAHHLVLPALVLALPFAAGHFLLMRAGVVNELGSDYLLLGRAKGLRERRLKYRYAARNALLPAVTLAALHLSAAVATEAIVVETVFSYPGLGRLLFEAISFRDYPTLQACFLILTLIVVTANFLVELLYRKLDPRTIA